MDLDSLIKQIAANPFRVSFFFAFAVMFLDVFWKYLFIEIVAIKEATAEKYSEVLGIEIMASRLLVSCIATAVATLIWGTVIMLVNFGHNLLDKMERRYPTLIHLLLACWLLPFMIKKFLFT